METEDVRRLRELERENEQLKILLVERDLEISVVDTRLNARRVRETLTPLMEARGVPDFVRSDNGSEFIARLLAVFLSESGSGSHFIRPGSPWQNAYVESFHSGLRRDFLDVEAFVNLADAQIRAAIHRRWYNEVRPHSSLGMKPPGSRRASWEFRETHPKTSSPTGQAILTMP